MEAVVFLFSLLDCCALIFLSVYFVSLLETGWGRRSSPGLPPGNEQRAGPAGAGRCGVRGRRRGPGSRAEEPSSVFSRPKAASSSRLSVCSSPQVPPGRSRQPGAGAGGRKVLPPSLVPGSTLAPLSSRVSALLRTPHTQEMTHSKNRRCASFTCGPLESFFFKKELLQKHPQSVFGCPRQWEICKFSNYL